MKYNSIRINTHILEFSKMDDKSRKNSGNDVEANTSVLDQQKSESVAKAVHGHPVSEHPTT